MYTPRRLLEGLLSRIIAIARVSEWHWSSLEMQSTLSDRGSQSPVHIPPVRSQHRSVKVSPRLQKIISILRSDMGETRERGRKKSGWKSLTSTLPSHIRVDASTHFYIRLSITMPLFSNREMTRPASAECVPFIGAHDWCWGWIYIFSHHNIK